MFAGFVACMEDTRLPKCVMFGELVGGAGCVAAQEKEWMGCFLDDLRAFGINADQLTTAAQDEGEWHRAVEQGGGMFHGEMDRCRESQGWTTTCSSMPERDGKDQGEDSPKASELVLVRLPLLSSHKWRELVSSGRLFADVMTSFSGVTFVLFRSVFVFLLSLGTRGPSFNRSSICMRPGSHTQLPDNCQLSFFCFCFFLFFVSSEIYSSFSEYFVHIYRFLLYVKSTSYVFSFRIIGSFYLLLCGHGLDFRHQLM